LVLVYILIGWVLPERFLLPYLVFVPLMIMQWMVNDGTCVLTNLENYLLGKERVKNQQQGQFLKGLVKGVCGREPSDRQLFWAVYLLLAVFWVVAACRWQT
jgi:hypothetical protein